jgi:hypothetical protein
MNPWGGQPLSHGRKSLRTARADLFVVDWSPSESRYLDRWIKNGPAWPLIREVMRTRAVERRRYFVDEAERDGLSARKAEYARKPRTPHVGFILERRQSLLRYDGEPTEGERNRDEHRQFIRKAIRPCSWMAFSVRNIRKAGRVFF